MLQARTPLRKPYRTSLADDLFCLLLNDTDSLLLGIDIQTRTKLGAAQMVDETNVKSIQLSYIGDTSGIH
jgi:hypothetical protein